MDRFSWIRQPRILYLLFSLILISYPAVVSYLTSSPVTERVLLVGDVNEKGSFAYQVSEGITTACAHPMFGEQLEVVKIDDSQVLSLPDTSKEEASQRQLMDEISNGPVLAIIAATRSADTLPIIEIGRAFRIPVLLTVATNNSLGKVSLRTSMPLVFRLVPNDSKQAQAIANWVENSARLREMNARKNNVVNKPDEESNLDWTVFVAYDQGIYGSSLSDQVVTNLASSRLRLVQWRVDPEHDHILDLVKNAKLVHARMIVYLGYYKEAHEILQDADCLGFTGPILLSDGSITPALYSIDNMRPNTYVSQPAVQSAVVSEGKKFGSAALGASPPISGFEAIGSDAYYILSAAAYANGHHNQKDSLITQLMTAPSAVEDKLFFRYAFTNDGQNDDAEFGVTKLQH